VGFHTEERVIIAKNRPLNPLQFNLMAIVLLLVVLPFAVAFVSNAGDNRGGDFDDSFDHSEGFGSTYGGIPIFWWNNGGENFSSLYSGSCGMVEEGRCESGNSVVGAQVAPVFDRFFHPAQGLVVEQTHHRVSNYGVDPYIGESGDGPYEWYIPKGSQNNLLNNETIDTLRYGFIDHQNNFNCETHSWVDLDVQFEIQFRYDNKTKTYSGFAQEVSNKFKHTPYPNYVEECNVGFYLNYEFNAFEALELVNWNGGNWDETDFFVKINQIERDDGLYLGNTALPFAGNGEFTLTSEFSSIDEVQANFFINAGTLVLSVLTFALAIASTPYWDPFKNLFRGSL